MLERYYTRARYADQVRALWLGPAIDRYVEWLDARHAARDTVKRSIQALVQFNHFTQSRGALTWDELPSHVEPFMAKWMKRRGSWCRTQKDRACVNANGRTPVEQLLRLLVPGFVGTQRVTALPFVNSAPKLFPHLTLRNVDYDRRPCIVIDTTFELSRPTSIAATKANYRNSHRI